LLLYLVMELHLFDPYTTLAQAAVDGRIRTRRKPAFSTAETCHHFAIESLDRPGPLRPQPYLYTCVRCKWIFRINDSRGSVLALDGLGRRLAEPENAKRVATFHRGPCPAFPNFEYAVGEIERESRIRAHLSSFVGMLRSLTDWSGRRSRSRGRQTTAS
jgi:hypothetical protein